MLDDVREKIKKMQGINHAEFDDLINQFYESAKLDLAAVGIADSILSNPNSLVITAIETYILSLIDVDNAELYQNSYSLQKDSLRHNSFYTDGPEKEDE